MIRFFFSLMALSVSVMAATISGAGSISGVGAMSSSAVAPSKATTPSPIDTATRVFLNGLILSWANGGGAVTFNVLLDTVNPPVAALVTGTASTSVSAGSLDYAETYFWRVDSINGTGTTTGDVWSFTSVTPIVVDSYTDFENGSVGNALSATILDNSTHGDIGTWSVSMAIDAELVGATTRLPTPVTVGATTYEDTSGTRASSFDNQTDENFARTLFAATHDSVSMGGIATFGTPVYGPGAAVNLDHVMIDGQAGDFGVLQMNQNGTIIAHTSAGGTTGITVTLGIPYWFTMKYVKNDKIYISIYNLPARTLVGSKELALLDQTSSAFRFGRCDAHGNSPPSVIIFDNIIVDFTNAVYPLGP